jgi:hypothetical protein
MTVSELSVSMSAELLMTVAFAAVRLVGFVVMPKLGPRSSKPLLAAPRALDRGRE